MQAHPLAEQYPLIEGADFEALCADIEAHGLRHPVVLFEGLILDGRNRYRACERLGITPTYTTYTGGDPAGFVASMNDHRRHEDKEVVRRRRQERLAKGRIEGKSLRRLAEEEGISHEQVRKDLSQVSTGLTPDPIQVPAAAPTSCTSAAPGGNTEPSSAASPPAPAPAPAIPAVTGRDGKRYAARAAKPVAKKTPRKAAGNTVKKAMQCPPGACADFEACMTRMEELLGVQGWELGLQLGQHWEIADRMRKIAYTLYKQSDRVLKAGPRSADDVLRRS